MNIDKNKEYADKLSDMVNSFSFSATDVAKAMTMEHKTLQQNFTRLCIEWLKVCASDDYRTDGRNEDSHNIAKEIVTAYNHNHTETSFQTFDDIGLPFI